MQSLFTNPCRAPLSMLRPRRLDASWRRLGLKRLRRIARPPMGTAEYGLRTAIELRGGVVFDLSRATATVGCSGAPWTGVTVAVQSLLAGRCIRRHSIRSFCMSLAGKRPGRRRPSRRTPTGVLHPTVVCHDTASTLIFVWIFALTHGQVLPFRSFFFSIPCGLRRTPAASEVGRGQCSARHIACRRGLQMREERRNLAHVGGS